MRYSFSISVIIFATLLVCCPDPPEETTCGQGMILQADTCACIPNSHPVDDGESCECESMYHWNEDLTECILDTISHDITWVIDTLGLPGSWLNDVSIVNENNIWAVGEILLPDPDSSFDGTGIEHFNIAQWNGTTWKFSQILNGSLELFDILFFSDDDIWVTSGLPLHWDGQEWKNYNLWDMGIIENGEGNVRKMWADSPNSIWFVGSGGAIVHYDGVSFWKHETGTKIRLNHIYGTAGNNIWALGDDAGFGIGESVLLSFDGTGWSTKYYYKYNDPNNALQAGPYRGVWACGDTLYLSGGRGLWRESITSGEGRMEYAPQSIYPSGVTRQLYGTAYNDIFDIGFCNKINHFNGGTWIRSIPLDCSEYHVFEGIDIYRDNTVSIVGGQYVFKGYR